MYYPLAFGSPRHHALSRFQNSELYRKRIAGEYRRALPFGALSEEKYFRFATPHQSPGNQQPARCIEKKFSNLCDEISQKWLKI